MDVPAQCFRSVIAIELGVAAAPLWQSRFFESSTARLEGGALPDAPSGRRPGANRYAGLRG